MICFLRCAPVSEDIRLRKYTEACRSRDVSFFAITWDRMKRSVKEDYEIQFQMLAPYGNRYKNAWSRIIWQFFVFVNLLKNKKKYSIIHVTNFENILPALLTKFFCRKKVVYDIYDSSSVDISNKILLMFMRNLDRFCIRKSDILILPAKERLIQMSIDRSDYKIFLEVENVPNIKDIAIPENNLNINNIKLSYVGDFDYNRGLEELLEFVNNNSRITLDIAGRGSLKKIVEEYSTKNTRIVYYGQVPYEKGLEIMKKSDFVLGMYYTKNGTLTNHIYASPNKYCESLYLAKPLITTCETLVGDRVKNGNTGYVIGESVKDLQILFDKYNKSNPEIVKEYDEIINNAAELWNQKYVNYFEKVLKTDYIDLVNKI
ncbi:glycosyltransferase [Chryseobacterium sp. S-02]|uniref:glycosyltransferase n=1 Tax=Chryseobacterium sp. S-02 TaxID=3404064 RepID=UPI003CE98F83